MSEFKCGRLYFGTRLHKTPLGVSAWRWWIACGVETIAQGYACTEAEAQAAADAALASLNAEMLRDLLGGPEWEGLGEALGRALFSLETSLRYTAMSPDDMTTLMCDVSLLRRLAEALKGGGHE